MFSRRLSLATLIQLCRTLRHYLSSGLTVLDAFRQQARSGPAAARPVATDIAAALAAGTDLPAALRAHQESFPPLFIALARVGEETGMLPEVLGELEQHYLRQQKLRWDFVGQITWPVTQLVLAILVIAGLIFFLGAIADVRGPGAEPYDPLGLGLLGASGAAIFLGSVLGLVLALVVTYLVLTRLLGGRLGVHRLLLSVPAIGPCLRVLAVSRFCMALRLTYETGMPLGQALRLALDATGNPVFEAAGKEVTGSIRRGRDLTTTLARTDLFPGELIHTLAVAEESGRLSEVLRHQAAHYHEEAGRRLKVLTALAGYGVWMLVGGIIILAIFRLAGSYFTMLDKTGL